MRRFALLAFSVFLLGAAPAHASCPADARCSAIQVPLDHSGATPGGLPLGYAVVPATGTSTGTLVVLTGGPGQPAIPFARGITALLDPLHLSYDFVFPDARGTGRSGAVHCKRIATPAQISACAAALGPKRAFLNTYETARDLEDLRVKLGADKLTLLGVSYGTKVAGEYARLFPQHTAAVILDSPVGVGSLDGTFALRQEAMPRVLREVCRTGPCARTVADPAAALKAAAARVEKAPVKGPYVSSGGRVKTVAVDESALYAVMLASDANDVVRVFLPSVLESLAKGDAAPFLHLEGLFAGLDGGDDDINAARLLATTCIESALPWAPDSPPASRPAALQSYVAASAGPFAPFRAGTVTPFSSAGQCMSWPPTPAPPAVPQAGPDVPVLVLSGRDDLRTPLEDARRIAGQYPRAQVLAVPGVGHSVLTSDATGCAATAVVDFVRGQPVKRCSGSESLGAVAYLPAAAAALARTRLPGSAGRALTALRETMSGIALDHVLAVALRGDRKRLRLGGLRGGFTSIAGARLTLHRVQWFRGLRVSGYFDNTAGRGRLTVSGPGGGTVSFSGTTATGTLGGHRITARDFD